MSSLEKSSGKSDGMKLLWNQTNKTEAAERSREQIGVSSFRWSKKKRKTKILLWDEEGLCCSIARSWEFPDFDLCRKEEPCPGRTKKQKWKIFFHFILIHSIPIVLFFSKACLILVCFLKIQLSKWVNYDNTWNGKYCQNLLK